MVSRQHKLSNQPCLRYLPALVNSITKKKKKNITGGPELEWDRFYLLNLGKMQIVFINLLIKINRKKKKNIYPLQMASF